jgi:hypothetical protein
MLHILIGVSPEENIDSLLGKDVLYVDDILGTSSVVSIASAK